MPLHAELYTTSPLHGPAEGRALLDAITRHMPSWTPHRYGQTQPLRDVYDPEKGDHFWSHPDGLMFRNAQKTTIGEVTGRVGPWDMLSKIMLSGLASRRELDSGAVGRFLAECGKSMKLDYAMAHVFSDKQAEDYYRAWFDVPSAVEENVRCAAQGPFPYYLRDLYWANVFGPEYTELFGADRIRTAPAAVVTDLGEGRFYVQVTSKLSDLYTPDEIPGYRAARDAVKEHLGTDVFYLPDRTVPYRAPAWRTAAEDGLWTPVEGTWMTDELQEMLDRAASREH